MKKHELTTRQNRRPQPLLKFTPLAWAKLVWLRDQGPTEIGGFGIAPGDDPLLITDIRLVRQHTTSVTVAFDDDSVADLFDELVDAGLRPEQFARVWIHTHPGDCPAPSDVDEQTFDRCFGRTDWSVMFILARGGDSYGRLRFNVGPSGSIKLRSLVDWSAPFGAVDVAAWEREYELNVINAEEVRFTIPHLAAEFDSTEFHNMCESWPEDWFVDPHFQPFLKEPTDDDDE